MEGWQAALLGFVEGLTEFLPVSSTAHLLLLQWQLGLSGDAASAYAICIQSGAIVAVLGLYRSRLRSIATGLAGRDPAGARLAGALALAFAPAAALGLALHEWIERELFRPLPIAVALLAGGAAILIVDRYRRTRPRELRGAARSLEQLTSRQALLIGLFQCAALWPGTSRSLATIVGGVLVGLELKAAVEFSFLLGALTLLAATAYGIVQDGAEMLGAYSLGSMALGFVCAWLSAVLAVRWMVGYLERHGLAVFGWYRVALAALVVARLAA